VASCTRSVSYSKSNQSCIVYIRLLCFAVTEQLDMNIKSKKKVKVRQSIMYGAVTLCLDTIISWNERSSCWVWSILYSAYCHPLIVCLLCAAPI